MNKGIPTLLGVSVILLVVILVLSIYNLSMLGHLAQGDRVVGTTVQKVLSGGQLPEAEASVTEAAGRPLPHQQARSQGAMQAKSGKTQAVEGRRAKREEQRSDRRGERQAAAKPGGR